VHLIHLHFNCLDDPENKYNSSSFLNKDRQLNNRILTPKLSFLPFRFRNHPTQTSQPNCSSSHLNFDRLRDIPSTAISPIPCIIYCKSLTTHIELLCLARTLNPVFLSPQYVPHGGTDPSVGPSPEIYLTARPGRQVGLGWWWI
jgi:hypothetical protein